MRALFVVLCAIERENPPSFLSFAALLLVAYSFLLEMRKRPLLKKCCPTSSMQSQVPALKRFLAESMSRSKLSIQCILGILLSRTCLLEFTMSWICQVNGLGSQYGLE